MNLKCTSCMKPISESGAISFNCPNCNEFQIVRCRHCREIAAKYVCRKCSFTGPN